MKFYRVCHLSEMGSSGHDRAIHSGPYNSLYHDIEGMGYAHGVSATHPSVRLEFPDECIREFACGFNSMEQFEGWFDAEWRDEMHRVGFVLRVFELDPADVRVGDTQSIALISAIQEATESAEIVSLEIDDLVMV